MNLTYRTAYYLSKTLIPRLDLDVDIGAKNWELESTFLNYVVWLHTELPN